MGGPLSLGGQVKMAISHIGRRLREETDREKLRIAISLLEGGTSDINQVFFYRGFAEGLKWTMAKLDDIESEG